MSDSKSADSGSIEATTLIDPLLVSNFVHQIINPLNGVIGTLDNVIDGTVKDVNKRQKKLEAVRAQLEHSIELIRNLAFLSSLSTAGLEPLAGKATDVVLPQVIIEAALFFQDAGHVRNIHIRLTDEKTQYTVKGHLHLLRQVFINLFDNAIKYSSPDTTVLVTPRVQKHTNMLIIEVSNTGHGFDQSERENIFSLGYRGSIARQLRASGTGLGLYLCRRILEVAHGATISADYSAKLKKTTFSLRFPQYTLGADYVKQ